ncbi:hypothetical protein SAMD00019534_013530, partial [Acytostelium subglobosum LB1]|uniref:hypothetical protein n=1 Tax=Acytostelium subglobosum LB1 TaxID=1410327 RepID=UPI000644BC7C
STMQSSIKETMPLEISPSYGMKLSNVQVEDIWADNIDEDCPTPAIMSTTLGGGLYSYAASEYYNFNFRMGAPIGGKDFDLRPTYSL